MEYIRLVSVPSLGGRTRLHPHHVYKNDATTINSFQGTIITNNLFNINGLREREGVVVSTESKRYIWGKSISRTRALTSKRPRPIDSKLNLL